jgi:hypothetical protein
MAIHTVTFTKCNGCGDDTLANPNLKIAISEKRFIRQGEYASVDLCPDCIDIDGWYFCERCRDAHQRGVIATSCPEFRKLDS